MKNPLLYIATVLIWGSTWLAIEYQLGEVPVIISVVYRFALAAIVMWAYCLIARVPMAFSARNHGFIFLLALFNFSMNYAVLYSAQNYLSSAMASIAFSTMLLMNIVNTRIFFGSRITKRVYIGALFGILGIIALFWNDLAQSGANHNSLLGLSLVIGGAFIASLGNMVSVRNSRAGMNIFAVNAWGMLYGACVLIAIALAVGADFTFSEQPSYLISLVYLSVFGTVIAFATYYVLLNNMPPEKASYVIVLFPIVAVALSSLFEDFILTDNIILGFVLVLLGNAILLTPIKKLATIKLFKP